MKIESKLLALMYPTVDTVLLMDIITATPNPVVATEILCGLYVRPAIQELPCEKFKTYRKQQADFRFVGYNKWDNQVIYCYKEIPSKTVWCLKNEPIVEYKDINPIYCEYYPKDVISKAKLTMRTEEEFRLHYERKTVYGEPVNKESSSSTPLSEWQDGEYAMQA